MRFVVGVDVEREPHAALRLVAGLLGRRPHPALAVRAVHVLTEEHLRVALRLHHLAEVEAGARAAVAATLEREGVAAPVEVRQAIEAWEGLAAAVEDPGEDLLVVGRHAGKAGRGIVRLGRVARNLVRLLPAPLVVVPHDLEEADVGSGPVVALTDLSAGSLIAVRLGGRLAGALGRALSVVRVAGFAEADPPADPGALAAWLERAAVHADALQVAPGDPAAAREISLARAAPLLVVAAGPQGEIPGDGPAAVAIAIAASSPVPVVVVPATPEGRVSAGTRT